MTDEEKRIRCSKARMAADDLFRAIEELIQVGEIPDRREHARIEFIRALAMLAALSGDFVSDELS